MGGFFGSGGGKGSNTTEELKTQFRLNTSAYGIPVTIQYGTNRIPGNIIWFGDFMAIPHVETQTQSGGKGGGSTTSTRTTYTYTISFQMGICEGPITGIGTIWAGKNKI